MKNYNELFELAKGLHSEAKSDKDVKSLELIERLFPQLKETEDEKTLADLKKLVCARADSRDVERFTNFLSRATPVFTDKEESFCEHILPRIVNNPFEWSPEQRSADIEYLKEFIDNIKGRFVTKHTEEDNDNEVSETNDKILGTMLSHFKAKTKSDWCGLPVRDIIAWLEKQKEARKAIEAVERIDKYIDEHLANAHDMKDSNSQKEYYLGWDAALGKMSGILQDVYSNENQKEQKPNIVEKLREISTPAKEDWFEIEKKWETEDNEDLRSFISVKFASNAKVIDGKRFAVFTWERFKDVALDFVNRGKEQKPAEWSEEDETHLIHTIHLIEDVLEWAKKDGLHRRCVASCDKILPWLKSFRSKPKQESEPMKIKYAGKIYKVYGTKEFPGGIVGYKIEDEPGDFNYIINPDEVLGGYDIKSNGSFYPAKEANFSQPHWKPSEEQMEALWNLMHYAVNLCSWPELEKSIESLYKDLKKL